MSSTQETAAFMKLPGTVVVAGGTHGLGKAFSVALAQAGSNVAILYRESKKTPEDAKQIQEEFPQVKVRAYECDVSDFGKLQQTLKHIEQDLGGERISGVIANADASVVKPALELSREEFERVYNVNVYGVFNTCRAAAKLWADRNEEGSIVITASMSAQIINQAGRNKALTQAFYNSSKAAVRNLARGLAAEWAERRIRVNSVSPGYVETDETSDVDKKILQHQQENVPLRRFAQPKEIAGQTLFLLSRHASYMTGGDYLVDGGQLIW